MAMFIHKDPTLVLDATLASVVTNASTAPEPLWGFDSIGYLDVVDPSWLEGTSYPCSATGFVPSVVTTSASSCGSPNFLSSITESMSTPHCRWQAFCSSDVHPQLELPSPTFSVNSSSESDLPNCSPNAVGPFSDFLAAEVMLDDDNEFFPKFQHNLPVSSLLGNSLGDTFLPARFQPPPSVSSKKASHFARRKGLAGWGDTTNMQVYGTLSFPPKNKRRRSSLCSLRAYPRRLSKRTRHEPNPSGASSGFLTEDEHPSQDEDDSDDYRPSPSPSPGSPPPVSPLPNDPRSSRTSNTTRRRGGICKSKKAKSTGSAAFALALVTHASEAKREEPSCRDPQYDWPDPFIIKKRKNQPIPIPVPVANLNKKSRGRKVPSISVTPLFRGGAPATVTAAPVKTEEEDVKSDDSGWAPRESAALALAPYRDRSAGSRTFVCVIPGCGKCFVRSEHLKRHVRSIHTHDKPHVCPFDGCDKSFSRRDNLGQHVRVHLQP